MNIIDQKSFLGVKNAGFTLIELLVVVLIIGILSAVALPQYNKAVEKSRGSQALVNLKAIVNSMDLYQLANGGALASNLSDLDILPEGVLESGVLKSKEFSYSLHADLGSYQAVATSNTKGYDFSTPFGGHGLLYCVAWRAPGYNICAGWCNAEPTASNEHGYRQCRMPTGV